MSTIVYQQSRSISAGKLEGKWAAAVWVCQNQKRSRGLLAIPYSCAKSPARATTRFPVCTIKAVFDAWPTHRDLSMHVHLAGLVDGLACAVAAADGFCGLCGEGGDPAPIRFCSEKSKPTLDSNSTATLTHDIYRICTYQEEWGGRVTARVDDVNHRKRRAWVCGSALAGFGGRQQSLLMWQAA
jgi:hypothetical protein